MNTKVYWKGKTCVLIIKVYFFSVGLGCVTFYSAFYIQRRFIIFFKLIKYRMCFASGHHCIMVRLLQFSLYFLIKFLPIYFKWKSWVEKSLKQVPCFKLQSAFYFDFVVHLHPKLFILVQSILASLLICTFNS